VECFGDKFLYFQGQGICVDRTAILLYTLQFLLLRPAIKHVRPPKIIKFYLLGQL
jgi:hypothetical protein